MYINTQYNNKKQTKQKITSSIKKQPKGKKSKPGTMTDILCLKKVLLILQSGTNWINKLMELMNIMMNIKKMESTQNLNQITILVLGFLNFLLSFC